MKRVIVVTRVPRVTFGELAIGALALAIVVESRAPGTLREVAKSFTAALERSSESDRSFNDDV